MEHKWEPEGLSSLAEVVVFANNCTSAAKILKEDPVELSGQE